MMDVPAPENLLERARAAALGFMKTLPSYVCQEVMARYQSETAHASWQPLDVVSTNVVYENGKEDYRDVAIDGRRVNKKIEEIAGSWSTGEFGTVLIDLFSPATAADFAAKGESRSAGIVAKLYDFSVKRENSHWEIHMGSQRFQPPYKGSVWIDPQTGRALRVEMQAFGFPGTFPADHVESATDYQYTLLGDGKQYLLPVHAETLSCRRGTYHCSRNAIDFRGYLQRRVPEQFWGGLSLIHKYQGESTNPAEQLVRLNVTGVRQAWTSNHEPPTERIHSFGEWRSAASRDLQGGRRARVDGDRNR